ncbi:MAG: restriction endonuclease subunit S [Ruminococcus sp.]|nr:restriction endonuclease subunit S [Ruminococcus sp.]
MPFTWEQRKCGSFAKESSEKGHTGADAKKLKVKLHTNGVYEADEKTQGSDNTQYYIRSAGQFIYGKQNFFNGAIGVVPKSLDKYESTKDVPAFDIDESVNVEWLYQYMARPEIYKPQELNCTGTGSKRFHVNNFFDMEIPTPCLKEQEKIADFFTHLDHLITLHQCEYIFGK